MTEVIHIPTEGDELQGICGNIINLVSASFPEISLGDRLQLIQRLVLILLPVAVFVSEAVEADAEEVSQAKAVTHAARIQEVFGEDIAREFVAYATKTGSVFKKKGK